MQGMQTTQQKSLTQQVWVRRVEHGVLRVVSLGFSLASAHAIRWFFAPLDRVDALQPAITWMIAIGFGLLGYFVSRGLAHRLMNGERIRAYAPICLIVEVVEIVCNYALAAAVIQQATWLHAVATTQRAFLTGATYMVLSIIPLVSLLLAVVDMDLERKKDGVGRPGPLLSRLPIAKAGQAGNSAASPAYSQGYAGNGAVPKVANGADGKGGFKFPFPRRGGDDAGQPRESVTGRNMLYDPEKELARIP